MYKVLLLVFFNLLVCSSFGTAIVVIITKNSVVLATDSRINTSDLNIHGSVKSSQRTKVFKTKGYYFAMSGYLKDPVGEYNAPLLVHNILNKNGDFEEAKKLIQTQWGASFKRELEGIKRYNPYFYYKELDNYNKAALVVIRRVNSVPEVFLLEFTIIDNKYTVVLKSNTKVFSCNNILPYPGYITFALGSNKAISEALKQNISNKKVLSGPEVIAEELIKLEVKSNPINVGPPIDILKLSRESEVWVKKQKTTPKEFD